MNHLSTYRSQFNGTERLESDFKNITTSKFPKAKTENIFQRNHVQWKARAGGQELSCMLLKKSREWREQDADHPHIWPLVVLSKVLLPGATYVTKRARVEGQFSVWYLTEQSHKSQCICTNLWLCWKVWPESKHIFTHLLRVMPDKNSYQSGHNEKLFTYPKDATNAQNIFGISILRFFLATG